MPESRSPKAAGRRRPRALSAKRAFALAAIAVVLACSWAMRFDVAFAQYSPTLQTDSTAYAGGDEVTVKGRDFVSGETVAVRVLHADGAAEPGMGHDASTGVVRSDGTFTTTWRLNGLDLSGPAFIATAVGSVSGEVAPAAFWRIAAIGTDKSDYFPGETVAISGRGFAPNELVTIQVTHADGRTDGSGHEPFYATADAAGSITANWFVNHDALGFKFRVSAKGDTSGVGGSATFWDAGPFIMTTLGTAYTDNFNTLATSGTANVWTDDSTLPGWFSQQTAGVGPTTYRADAGTSNAGAVYSYGTGTATERALGSVGSGTPGNFLHAVRLVNNTGSTITSLDISYTGEQWRAGGCTPAPCTPAAQKLDFQYQVANSGVITDANTPATGWTDSDVLDFTSPTPGTSTAAALDGNAAANRTLLASTLTLSVNPGQEIWLRWLDTNDANNDHGLAIDDFSATPQGAGSGTPSLSLNDVSLSEGNAGTTTYAFTVSLSAPAPAGGVTFDIATADGTATDPTDYTAKTLTSQSIPAGSSTYTFEVVGNGDTTTEPNETFLVNVTNVTGATVADGQGQGTMVNDEFALTKIHDIQGTSGTAALSGTQTVEGIVVATFPGATKLSGFFVQEEDTDADADVTSSEGIFVFDPTSLFSGSVGDKVRVTGTVSEFATTSANIVGTGSSSLTELTASSVTNLGASTLPTVTSVVLPQPLSVLERYEGMRVSVSSTSGSLVVTETFKLGRYGQVGLSGGSRLNQFTQTTSPSVAGYSTYLASLQDNYIILDDGSSTQNPDPVIFARGGNPLSAANTLRGGDTIASISGVLDHRYEGYRVQTTTAANFMPTSVREATAPSVGGTFRVASGNLLNFFNGDGLGGGFPTSRGADTLVEFNRQLAKTVQEVLGLDADVFGYNEIENDGFGANSAVQQLVDALNAATAPGTYAFVLPPASALNGSGGFGSDEITVGFIYRPNSARIAPGTSPAALTTGIFTQGPGVQRPPLAVTFERLISGAPTGQTFTVSVNHFKSKGSAANLAGDADAGDGQGLSNATRTAAAQQLAAWLATNPTGTTDSDYLIMGDLNAYRLEDPVATLINAGFASLFGPESYSYQFNGQWGSLDHALASASMATQVTGAAKWHINSDEPVVLDYNTEFKSVGQVSSFYSVDPFRTSDHDPIVLGLTLLGGAQATLTVTGPSSVTFGTTGTATATGGSGTGALTFSAAGSTGCAVVGTTVSVTDASGTCSLTATKAGDGTYASTTSAPFAVSLVKAAQTITFTSTPPASPMVGGTYAVAATGGASSNAVTFSSLTSGICTVTGNTVTFSAVGSCQVAADQLGDTNYSAAPQATQSMSVGTATQATLSVTGPMSVTFGTTGTATATGGSGTGALTFSAAGSTGCAVVGTTVSVTDASGTCSLTATKAGDGTYASTTSAPFAVSLVKAAQTITFTSTPPASPMVGGTYAVAATGGTSSNAVTFGSLTPGTCSVTGNTVSFLAVGSCQVSADQAGNTNYSAAPQVTQSMLVGATVASTTTTLASNNNPATVGQSITFTATVRRASNNSVVTTGTVTFREGVVVLAGPTAVNGAGQASFTTSALSAGSHTITATYNPTAAFATSSGNVVEVVNARSTETELESDESSSEFSDRVTFTARVRRGSTAVGTGTVTFREGTTILAANVPLNASGRANFSTSSLSVGSHTISATFNGTATDGASSDSVRHVVAKARTRVGLASSPNPSNRNQIVMFTASVTHDGNAVTQGTVTFREGSTVLAGPIALNASGRASFSISSLGSGNRRVTAVYSGTANYEADSTTLTQTVRR